MPNNTISDNLIRLNTAKNDIATAITNKGGTVSSGDGFEDFASDIESIVSGADIQEITLNYNGTAPTNSGCWLIDNRICYGYAYDFLVNSSVSGTGSQTITKDIVTLPSLFTDTNCTKIVIARGYCMQLNGGYSYVNSNVFNINNLNTITTVVTISGSGTPTTRNMKFITLDDNIIKITASGYNSTTTSRVTVNVKITDLWFMYTLN